jgi:hypothetical protein
MGLPVKNLRDGVLVIADDGGSAGSDKITVVLDEGNLSWTEENPVDMISDRGTLDHARQGNDVPVSGTFGIQYTTHLDPNSATITPYEAVTQQGGAAGWGSDASNGGDAYAVILEFTIADPAGGSSEVITFTEAYVEVVDFAEGTPSDIQTFNFRALITRPSYS